MIRIIIPIPLATLSVALLLLVACGQPKEIKELSTQIEVVHDDAMRDLVAMVRAKSALRKELAALDSMPNAPSGLSDSLTAVLSFMEKVDDDMKQWMREYAPPSPKTPREEAVRYLTEQKLFMENNGREIREATEMGNVWLRKVKN